MKKKTRSEVMEELKTAQRIIEKQLGTKVEIKEWPYNALYLEIECENAEHGHINGVFNVFVPDPVTKEAALKAAQGVRPKK